MIKIYSNGRLSTVHYEDIHIVNAVSNGLELIASKTKKDQL